jgi:hypothetical protein
LVSFVTFHEFGGNASQCVVEGLREIPEQFVQYFTNAGVKPLPSKPVPDFTGEETRTKPSNNATLRMAHEKYSSQRHDDDSAVDDLR